MLDAEASQFVSCSLKYIEHQKTRQVSGYLLCLVSLSFRDFFPFLAVYEEETSSSALKLLVIPVVTVPEIVLSSPATP